MELRAGYNIAPTSFNPIVIASPAAAGGGSTHGGVSAHWGLIPSWAKDRSIAASTVNARSETIASKPAFRAAFRSRRCVVPVSGFYEWTTRSTNVAANENDRSPGRGSANGPGRGKPVKTPSYIRRADGQIMCFAGIWERWLETPRDRVVGHDQDAAERDTPGRVAHRESIGSASASTALGPGAREVISFSIVTTAANGFMRRLHERMPVILEREDVDTWLGAQTEADELARLMQPGAEGVLMSHEVSRRVNSVREDSPELVRAMSAAERDRDLPDAGKPLEPGLFG